MNYWLNFPFGYSIWLFKRYYCIILSFWLAIMPTILREKRKIIFHCLRENRNAKRKRIRVYNFRSGGEEREGIVEDFCVAVIRSLQYRNLYSLGIKPNLDDEETEYCANQKNPPYPSEKFLHCWGLRRGTEPEPLCGCSGVFMAVEQY